jgi:hypothetical protein
MIPVIDRLRRMHFERSPPLLLPRHVATARQHEDDKLDVCVRPLEIRKVVRVEISGDHVGSG